MLLELEDLLQQAPGSIEDLLHQWPWQFLKRLPLPQGQMSFRPTPAKFQETGLLNGSTRPCMGPAPAGGATPAAEVSAAAAVPAGGAWGGRTTSLTRTGLAAAAALARWLLPAGLVALLVVAFFLDIGVKCYRRRGPMQARAGPAGPKRGP